MKNYGEVTVSKNGEKCRVYVFEMPDGTTEMATDHGHFIGTSPVGYVDIMGLYPYMGTQEDARRTAYNLAGNHLLSRKICSNCTYYGDEIPGHRPHPGD